MSAPKDSDQLTPVDLRMHFLTMFLQMAHVHGTSIHDAMHKSEAATTFVLTGAKPDEQPKPQAH